jgi:putative phosphoesterase
MARIGVISDTHISSPARVLPAAVWQAFAGVDMILHAGDLTTLGVLRELGVLCPVHAVYGNCDPPEVVARLPDKLVVPIEGVRIGLIHGHRGQGRTTPEVARRSFAGVGCIVFGHSHAPLIETREGVLLFNPGSALERRRQPLTSCGLLHVAGDAIRAELVWL